MEVGGSGERSWPSGSGVSSFHPSLTLFVFRAPLLLFCVIFRGLCPELLPCERCVIRMKNAHREISRRGESAGDMRDHTASIAASLDQYGD